MILSYVLLGLVLLIGGSLVALMGQGVREEMRRRGIPKRMMWLTSYRSAMYLGLGVALIGNNVRAIRDLGIAILVLSAPMLIGRLVLVRHYGRKNSERAKQNQT